jgi:hypothetical protein
LRKAPPDSHRHVVNVELHFYHLWVLKISTPERYCYLNDDRDGWADPWHADITHYDVIVDFDDVPVGSEPGPGQVPPHLILGHSHDTNVTLLLLDTYTADMLI